MSSSLRNNLRLRTTLIFVLLQTNFFANADYKVYQHVVGSTEVDTGDRIIFDTDENVVWVSNSDAGFPRFQCSLPKGFFCFRSSLVTLIIPPYSLDSGRSVTFNKIIVSNLGRRELNYFGSIESGEEIKVIDNEITTYLFVNSSREILEFCICAETNVCKKYSLLGLKKPIKGQSKGG